MLSRSSLGRAIVLLRWLTTVDRMREKIKTSQTNFCLTTYRQARERASTVRRTTWESSLARRDFGLEEGRLHDSQPAGARVWQCAYRRALRQGRRGRLAGDDGCCLGRRCAL